MPQLDLQTFPPQLFWLAVIFIVLYVLMATLALPRLEKVVEARRARIDGDLERASQMKAEAEAVIAAYEKALAEARANAQATVKATTDRLAAEAAERQKQAAAKLAAMTAEAEKRVADAKAAALGNVRSVASEVARAAAHRLIGGDIDEAQAATAVDAVLQERG